MSRLLAVAPFSVRAPGGGPRIMRTLLRDAPTPVVAVSTSPERRVWGSERDDVPEVRISSRPYFGRLERTRGVSALGALDLVLLGVHARRLERLASGAIGPTPKVPATCLHAVPHSLDFASVQRVAARRQLPLFLSLHDDPSYVMRGRLDRRYALRRLGVAWRQARQRYVICEEMGFEMCRRYGERPYVIVTDGLATVAPSAVPRVAGRLWVYFMGGASISYDENFQSLLRALALLREEGVDARLVTRAGRFPFDVNGTAVPVEARPWAPQTDVVRDLQDVDVAYMPLPFGPDHAEFVRFSMSTKMVTYLGSGVPVLFHGPPGSAAGNLLRRADAALVAGSLDVRSVAEALRFGADRGSALAENALRLARQRFLLSDVRARFWQPILDASESGDAARDGSCSSRRANS